MNLLVVSHKETWLDPASPSGYSTVGGFPFQMEYISSLFDRTSIMVPIQKTEMPSGARHLIGHYLSIIPLVEPSGKGFLRKVCFLFWFLRHLPLLWRKIGQADAVHTPVGGDIGTVGLLIALIQKKPLFVRHCGTWGMPISFVDRLLQRFLEMIAGGRNVVLATGGGDQPPSKRNVSITWIFATSLTREQLSSMEKTKQWNGFGPMKLVTVGRLSSGKNMEAIINALPVVIENYPEATLDVIGDGELMERLKQLVYNLSLDGMVIFHGNIPHKEVLKILSNSHIFVFPTFREGFPKSLLEAMACGLPLVATRTSVIPSLISDCGYIMDYPSPEEVSNGVLTLSSDPAQWLKFSTIAHQKSLEYSLENWRDMIGQKLESAWGKLSNQ